MRTALVTGLSGQDGSYLAELLVARDYAVHALVRGGRLGCARHLRGRVVEHDGDVRDQTSVTAAVRDAAPDEVYHLAAVTHVDNAEDDSVAVRQVIAEGTESILAAVVKYIPSARVFCASSAEAFGTPDRAPQDETTPLRPRNAYGEAKAEALEAARAARDGGCWVSAGILYNHESPRRPVHFVTRKVTTAAAAIALGHEHELRLGDLDAQRDWGYAPEYVEGMWRTLQADEPEDYVFATGQLHSVRELVEIAFARAGVAVEGCVVVDPAFVRPAEPVPIVGDSSKARRVLGWEPSKPFEEMIAEMVDHDMSLLSA